MLIFRQGKPGGISPGFFKIKSMTYFESEATYIVASQDDQDRLTRLKQVITALENQMIVAATDANIEEYSLNDGQVTIRTKYRNPDDILKSINTLEAIYNRLFYKLSGQRIVSLRDARSFNTLQRT